MNKLLFGHILILFITLFGCQNNINANNVNEAEIQAELKYPMLFDAAIQEIIKRFGAAINVNDINKGIKKLEKQYSFGSLIPSFALHLKDMDSISLTNHFFAILKEFRKINFPPTSTSRVVFGSIKNTDIVSSGVFNGDVFLLSQDSQGLAVYLTFSPEEPKITFILVRAEWHGSWWDCNFNGFSYFSYTYDTESKEFKKRYSYDKRFDEKETWY